MKHLVISAAVLAILSVPVSPAMAQHGHLIGADARPPEPAPGQAPQGGQPPQGQQPQGGNRGGDDRRGDRGGNRGASQQPVQAPQPQAQGGPQVWGQPPQQGQNNQVQNNGRGYDNRGNDNRGGNRDYRGNDNGRGDWRGNRGNDNRDYGGNGRDWRGDNRYGDRGYNGQRRDFSSFRDYHRDFRASRRFRGPDYRRPTGWYDHRWTFGEFLPSAFWARNYWLSDFGAYDLPPPPYGATWVRVGTDALLIDQDSGEVITVRYNVFY